MLDDRIGAAQPRECELMMIIGRGARELTDDLRQGQIVELSTSAACQAGGRGVLRFRATVTEANRPGVAISTADNGTDTRRLVIASDSQSTSVFARRLESEVSDR